LPLCFLPGLSLSIHLAPGYLLKAVQRRVGLTPFLLPVLFQLIAPLRELLLLGSLPLGLPLQEGLLLAVLRGQVLLLAVLLSVLACLLLAVLRGQVLLLAVLLLAVLLSVLACLLLVFLLVARLWLPLPQAPSQRMRLLPRHRLLVKRLLLLQAAHRLEAQLFYQAQQHHFQAHLAPLRMELRPQSHQWLSLGFQHYPPFAQAQRAFVLFLPQVLHLQDS
jgi:hypothetical protein